MGKTREMPTRSCPALSSASPGQIFNSVDTFQAFRVFAIMNNLVQKLLEPYVELNSADVSISLRKSTFRNVRLKRNCLMQFGFPVEILSGTIASLEASIELSTKRVDVRARDIIIVVESMSPDNSELRAFLSQLKMQKLEKVQVVV
jgi:hypothetical protein